MKIFMQQHDEQIFITYSLGLRDDFTFEVPSNTTVSSILNMGYLFAANEKDDDATENIINYTVPSSWKYIG